MIDNGSSKETPVTTDLPEMVAAVDLGSNSFHMVVARTKSGEIVVVDRLREMVRLAAGLGPDRRLDRESRERALACLHRFGERVRHMPPGSVRAVGTNTLRSARNAVRFLTDAETALGHPIETVSGIEEARLIYDGVIHSLPDPATRRLIVDIGGGSTELIVGQGQRPLEMDSLYLGCVSASRRHFDDGVIDDGRWRQAETEALRELEGVRSRYRSLGWEKAVGASGTIRAVERVVRSAGWSKQGITAKSLRRLRDALIAHGDVAAIRLSGLSTQRRPVFTGGVVILSAIFEALGVEQMDHAAGSLREGLLLDLVGRIRERDVRSATAAALAQRYHVDEEQAARVERTALQLLSRTAVDWKLTDREPRMLLSWAARLHEIGLDIAHASYHKHGEYVVANSDLMGFTRDEQRRLATLIRGHRRKFPSTLIRELPRVHRREIERLAILLRLAVLLHRSRSPEPVPTPTITVEKRLIRLGFGNGWLGEHPLTRIDFGQEASFLEAAGIRLEYA